MPAIYICACVCVQACGCVSVCGVGVKERKPGHVPACVKNNNWAMETKFNAFSVNLFVFVCSIPFYKYIVLKLVYLSM